MNKRKKYTAAELQVLDNIINEYGTIGIRQLTKKYNITPATFYKWLEYNPTYKERYLKAKYTKAEEDNNHIVEIAQSKLLEKVEDDHFPAIKFVLENKILFNDIKKATIRKIAGGIKSILPDISEQEEIKLIKMFEDLEKEII